MGFYRFSGGRVERVDRGIVQEHPITVSLNGRELVRFLCTPEQLAPQVVGFLYLEGIIQSIREIAWISVCAEEGAADVALFSEPRIPEKKAITSGCGGGITFNIDFEAASLADLDVRVAPAQLMHLMKELHAHARHYRETRGIHVSALSDGQELLIVAEDVGRHNTLDKIAGEALIREIPTEGRILISSGRISSEMLVKAARMRVPILASRTSPTAMAVELARRLGITVVGYLRADQFNLYTHEWRLDTRGWRGDLAP